MVTALITSLGSVAGDVVNRNLKQHGVRTIGIDIYPKEWVVDAYNVDVFYQCPRVSDADNYLNFIKKLCIDEDINYIITLTDVDVDFYNSNREWFIEHNVTVCISPKKSIDIIRNKKVLQDFVKDNCKKLPYIPTLMVKDVDKLPWEFPVVCKPFNGRSSQGLKYIYNDEEWHTFVNNTDLSNYIVEPYISGPLVMVEIVRDPKTKKVVTVTRQELLSTPHGCGLTVHIYQDTVLEEKCKDLAEKLDIIGSVNFEFIRHQEHEYYLVECNPRFSAGTEFTCLAGYDCVTNHLRSFTNEKIEDFAFKHEMIIARKYEEYVTKIEGDI